MSFFRHNFKVLNGVISGVAIFVVNDFGRQKVTPQMSLDSKPVNHHVPFAVRVRVFGCSQGKVPIARTVSDLSSYPLLARLTLDAAFKGAKFLIALTGGSGRLSAFLTNWRLRSTPTRLKITRARTILRSFGATVLWSIGVFTMFANYINVFVRHGSVYRVEEKYCEIAVNRLAQDVLDFSEASA